MIAPRRARMVGLSVGQRLLLGLAPALFAVVLVLGLAYYGEIGRQAPGYVVTGAAVLAAISLFLTWSNTRYLALRIRRLAGGVDPSRRDGTVETEDDELGRIEQVVERLGSALAESEAERRRLAERSEARLREQATMLGATARDLLAQLDEARLPLHILLDAPFGELNENQEELIVTARASTDAMDAALRRLMVVTDVDRDALSVLLERVALNDVLRAVLPMLRAVAERRNARLEVDLDPAVPRVIADRTRLAAVIALLGIASPASAQSTTFPPLNAPPTSLQIPGKLIWADLFTTDPEAATKFYCGVFGWTAVTLEQKGRTYTVFSNAGRWPDWCRGRSRNRNIPPVGSTTSRSRTSARPWPG